MPNFTTVPQRSAGARNEVVALSARITAFEHGELDVIEVTELFQELWDTGVIHHLQGSYQRTMADLIGAGEVAA